MVDKVTISPGNYIILEFKKGEPEKYPVHLVNL